MTKLGTSKSDTQGGQGGCGQPAPHSGPTRTLSCLLLTHAPGPRGTEQPKQRRSTKPSATGPLRGPVFPWSMEAANCRWQCPHLIPHPKWPAGGRGDPLPQSLPSPPLRSVLPTPGPVLARQAAALLSLSTPQSRLPTHSAGSTYDLGGRSWPADPAVPFVLALVVRQKGREFEGLTVSLSKETNYSKTGHTSSNLVIPTPCGNSSSSF